MVLRESRALPVETEDYLVCVDSAAPAALSSCDLVLPVGRKVRWGLPHGASHTLYPTLL